LSWAVFLAALASACLHASWNVIAKRQRVPSEAVLGIVLTTALVCLVALPLLGLPPPQAWPWLLAAAGFNVAYSRALMSAYDLTDLNLAYSTVRAMLPPMLVVLGYVLFGETVGTTALAGLALVAAALLLFGLHGRGLAGADARGIAVAALAGFVLAFSYAFDIKGARLSGGGLPVILQYGATSSLVTAAGLLTVSLIERREPLGALRRNWRACAAGAALLMASYFAALWAYVQGPVGLVAPVRETSVLFGGVLAWLVLRERIGPRQWLAIGLAAAGAVLIKIR
jgi:drug/metabolite transporter (DMT)-like permease